MVINLDVAVFLYPHHFVSGGRPQGMHFCAVGLVPFGMIQTVCNCQCGAFAAIGTHFGECAVCLHGGLFAKVAVEQSEVVFAVGEILFTTAQIVPENLVHSVREGNEIEPGYATCLFGLLIRTLRTFL